MSQVSDIALSFYLLSFSFYAFLAAALMAAAAALVPDGVNTAPLDCPVHTSVASGIALPDTRVSVIGPPAGGTPASTP
ncbi:MAG: hypothetical protein ABSA72_13360, partial [Nitrososphaerales archaeon]